MVAVDASKVGLKKAEVLATDREVNIETVVADLNEYEIEQERWEGIVSIFCHLPSDQRASLYSRIIKGLKPGGVLILEAYTLAQLDFGTGGPPVKDLLLSLTELEEAFNELDFKRASELERDIYEGKLHQGRGAVVQLIARKPL